MNRLNLFLLLLVASISTNTFANASGSGMEILKFSPSARISSMADSSVAMLHEIDNLYYNPAGVYSEDSLTGAMGYTAGFQEINYFHFSGRMNVKKIGNFGIGLVNILYGTISKVNDVDGDLAVADSKMNLGSWLLSMHFSRMIGDRFTAGVNLKIVNETIDNSETGAGLDLGAIYKITKNMNAGLSGLNIGIKNAPSLVRAGLQYEKKLNNNITGLSAVELEQQSDKDLQAGMGLEISFLKMVALRCGYKIGDTLGAFRFGAGIIYKNIHLDYGLVNYKDLGYMNRINFKVGI